MTMGSPFRERIRVSVPNVGNFIRSLFPGGIVDDTDNTLNQAWELLNFINFAPVAQDC